MKKLTHFILGLSIFTLFAVSCNQVFIEQKVARNTAFPFVEPQAGETVESIQIRNNSAYERDTNNVYLWDKETNSVEYLLTINSINNAKRQLLLKSDSTGKWFTAKSEANASKVNVTTQGIVTTKGGHGEETITVTVNTERRGDRSTFSQSINVRKPVTGITLTHHEHIKNDEIDIITGASFDLNATITNDNNAWVVTGNNKTIPFEVDAYGDAGIIAQHPKTPIGTWDNGNYTPGNYITNAFKFGKPIQIYYPSRNPVYWVSSNPKVAWVDLVTGNIHGSGPGTAYIAAVANEGLYAQKFVKIIPVKVVGPVTTVTITSPNPQTIGIGEEYETDFIKPADAVLIWTSSDETIATVDQQGKVTGLTVGETIISVTFAGGNTATYAIIVSNIVPVVTSVTIEDLPRDGTIENTINSLNAGEWDKFTAKVEGTDLSDSHKIVTWSITTSLEGVTISPTTGILTYPKWIKGNVTVTATSKQDSSKNNSVTITIRPIGVIIHWVSGGEQNVTMSTSNGVVVSAKDKLNKNVSVLKINGSNWYANSDVKTVTPNYIAKTFEFGRQSSGAYGTPLITFGTPITAGTSGDTTPSNCPEGEFDFFNKKAKVTVHYSKVFGTDYLDLAIIVNNNARTTSTASGSEWYVKDIQNSVLGNKSYLTTSSSNGTIQTAPNSMPGATKLEVPDTATAGWVSATIDSSELSNHISLKKAFIGLRSAKAASTSGTAALVITEVIIEYID